MTAQERDLTSHPRIRKQALNVLDPTDSFVLTPVAFDYDADGTVEQSDVSDLSARVIQTVQLILAPFDIDVVQAAAETMGAAVDSIHDNDAASENLDAYVFVVNATSDGYTANGGSVGKNAIPNGTLFGYAAGGDLIANVGNQQDEAAITFTDTTLEWAMSVLGYTGLTTGDPNYSTKIQEIGDLFVTALSNISVHEGLHTLGIWHTFLPNSEVSGDVMSAQGAHQFSGDRSLVTRGDLFGQNPASSIVNNYELLRDASNIGLRLDSATQKPTFGYVTGSGAHDVINLTWVNNKIHVVVTPYSDAGHTNQVTLLGTPQQEVYDIVLSTLATDRIVIDAGAKDDLIQIDGDIPASFDVRGMLGNDQATLVGKSSRSLHNVTIDGEAGDDKLVIDTAAGNPLPASGYMLTYRGGTGTNQAVIPITGTDNSDTYSFALNTSNANVVDVVKTGGATRSLDLSTIYSDADLTFQVDLKSGTDTVTVDANVPASFLINGMNGSDYVTLQGKSAAAAIRSFIFNGGDDSSYDSFLMSFVNGDPLPMPGSDFRFDGGGGFNEAIVYMGGMQYFPAYFVNTTADGADLSIDEVPDSSSAAGDQSTLRAAIQEANAWSVPTYVFVPAGHYSLSVTGADASGVADASVGDLDIHNNVVVIGTGAGSTVIDGSALPSTTRDRLFEIAGGGSGVARPEARDAYWRTDGRRRGAILVNDTSASVELSMSDVAVVGNLADPSSGGINALGGGIHVQPGTSATVARSVIANNYAYRGGGIYAAGSTSTAAAAVVTLDRTTLAKNVVVTSGPNIRGMTGSGSTPVSGTFTSSGGNLIESTSGATFTTQSSDYVNQSVDYVVTSVIDTFNHADDSYRPVCPRSDRPGECAKHVEDDLATGVDLCVDESENHGPSSVSRPTGGHSPVPGV